MNQETHDTDTLVPDDEWVDDEHSEEYAIDDDQPADEPTARRRRRTVPPVAIGLTAVAIAGLGFVGGVQVQKRSADEPGGGLPAGLAAMASGGGAAPGGAAPGAGAPGGGAVPGGTGGASSSATTGEVANVKGSRVYVTTGDGSTTEVSVGRTASVQRLASSSVDEIRPGDTVVLTGTTRSDGSVKATALQATASGVSLLGGIRGVGAAPGGRAAAPGSGAGGSGSGSDSGAASGGSDDAVDQLFESGD